MQKIGIFGGSFNPIHIGHLIAAQETLDAMKLDKVIFIPAGNPPHKSQRNLAAAEDRYDMVKLAIQNNPGFEISSMEMERSGKTYSFDTLKELKEQCKDIDMHFIIGFDTLKELHTWRNIQGIFDIVSFVVVNRGNEALEIKQWIEDRVRTYGGTIEYVPIPDIEISSTDIRHRIQDGRSIKYLVPDTVEQYIKSRGLYMDDTKIR
jgi:nicotinate-nucleotide adenylyltransferase